MKARPLTFTVRTDAPYGPATRQKEGVPFTVNGVTFRIKRAGVFVSGITHEVAQHVTSYHDFRPQRKATTLGSLSPVRRLTPPQEYLTAWRLSAPPRFKRLTFPDFALFIFPKPRKAKK